MPKKNFVKTSLQSLAFLGLIISNSLYAEDTSDKSNTEKACTANINSRNSARSINDWDQLYKLAKEFQKNCREVADNKIISITYADIGLSDLNFKHAMKALSSSQECINIFYNNFECHINQANALLELGKFASANEHILSTYKLINHLIEQNRLAIISARQNTEIKKLVSERTALEKNLNDATTLLDEFYLGHFDNIADSK